HLAFDTEERARDRVGVRVAALYVGIPDADPGGVGREVEASAQCALLLRALLQVQRCDCLLGDVDRDAEHAPRLAVAIADHARMKLQMHRSAVGAADANAMR